MFGARSLIRCRPLVLAGVAVFLCGLPAYGQQGGTLRIGSSGTIGEESKGKSAMDLLQNFIKDETGLANHIDRQKDWQELAGKLAKRQLDIGVFMGYEFAWAKAKYPQLEALALADNKYPYRQVFVVTNDKSTAKHFAGLAGQTLELPKNGQEYPRLVVDHLAQASGKDFDKFFSQVKTAETAEDALDDVVDNIAQAAAVDRVSLEAFKRRKPTRYAKLRLVAQSPKLPPPVIAYFEKALPDKTLQTFRNGLLNANQKEKGKELLNLFKLTAFEPVPADFDKMLETTRKDYPATQGAK